MVAYFPEFSGVGAFFNPTGRDVKQLDFYGRTRYGKKLQRVDTFKAGVFWCVWCLGISGMVLLGLCLLGGMI